MHTLSYMATAQSAIGACVLYFVETTKQKRQLNICTYYEKGASEVPRGHLRACKISQFPGDMHQTPVYYRPHFFYLPWGLPILSVVTPIGTESQLHWGQKFEHCLGFLTH